MYVDHIPSNNIYNDLNPPASGEFRGITVLHLYNVVGIIPIRYSDSVLAKYNISTGYCYAYFGDRYHHLDYTGTTSISVTNNTISIGFGDWSKDSNLTGLVGGLVKVQINFSKK